MNQEPSLKEIQKEWHGTLKSYLIGFFISIILTGASFALAALNLFKSRGITFTLIGLAVLQGLAQVLFFLHLGREPKPRWETLLFLFMVMVLFIVALGTLWIIYDLNNRVMPMGE